MNKLHVFLQKNMFTHIYIYIYISYQCPGGEQPVKKMINNYTIKQGTNYTGIYVCIHIYIGSDWNSFYPTRLYAYVCVIYVVFCVQHVYGCRTGMLYACSTVVVFLLFVYSIYYGSTYFLFFVYSRDTISSPCKIDGGVCVCVFLYGCMSSLFCSILIRSALFHLTHYCAYLFHSVTLFSPLHSTQISSPLRLKCLCIRFINMIAYDHWDSRDCIYTDELTKSIVH